VTGLLWTGKATAMLSPRPPAWARIHHRCRRAGPWNWLLGYCRWRCAGGC